MKTKMAMLLIVVGAAIVGGCAPRMDPARFPPRDYSVEELILLAEENTQAFTRFRSRGGRLTARIPTEGRIRRYDLDGVLVLYDEPRDMYLSGSFAGRPALLIGSNEERYWLGILVDRSRLQWGHWRYVDQGWQGGGPMMLMEALGPVDLRRLDGKLLGPVLQRREGANVLMYFAVDRANNWYIAKEAFLSLYEPIVANRIIYYGEDGSEELTIDFSDYRSVEDRGLMANRVELNWPEQESYLRLIHGRVQLVDELPDEAFEMPDPAGFDAVERLDEPPR